MNLWMFEPAFESQPQRSRHLNSGPAAPHWERWSVTGPTGPRHRSETPVRDTGPRHRSEAPVQSTGPKHRSKAPVQSTGPTGPVRRGRSQTSAPSAPPTSSSQKLKNTPVRPPRSLRDPWLPQPWRRMLCDSALKSPTPSLRAPTPNTKYPTSPPSHPCPCARPSPPPSPITNN